MSPVVVTEFNIFRQFVWAMKYDDPADVLGLDKAQFQPAFHALEQFCRLLDAPFSPPAFPAANHPRHRTVELFPPGPTRWIPLKAHKELEGAARLFVVHDTLVLQVMLTRHGVAPVVDMQTAAALFPIIAEGGDVFLSQLEYVGARVAGPAEASQAAQILYPACIVEVAPVSLPDKAGSGWLCHGAEVDEGSVALFYENTDEAERAASRLVTGALPDFARLAGKVRHQSGANYEEGLRREIEALETPLAAGIKSAQGGDIESAETELSGFAESLRLMTQRVTVVEKVKRSVMINLRNMRAIAEQVGGGTKSWFQASISRAEFALAQLEADLSYFDNQIRQANAELTTLQLRVGLERARHDRDTDDRTVVVTFFLAILGAIVAFAGLVDNDAARGIFSLFSSQNIGTGDSDRLVVFGIRVVAILLLGAASVVLMMVAAFSWRGIAKWLRKTFRGSK